MEPITYIFTVTDNNQTENLQHHYSLRPGDVYNAGNGKRIITNIDKVEVSGSQYRVYAKSRIQP